MLPAILVLSGMMTGTLIAQDESAPESAPKANATEQTTAMPVEEKPGLVTDEQRKENLVSILLMLLGGVGIMGVALVGMTMIWGKHARRIARHTDQPPTQQDELWYMRRPPPEDTETNLPATEENDPSTPDRETET